MKSAKLRPRAADGGESIALWFPRSVRVTSSPHSKETKTVEADHV